MMTGGHGALPSRPACRGRSTFDETVFDITIGAGPAVVDIATVVSERALVYWFLVPKTVSNKVPRAYQLAQTACQPHDARRIA
jgi:hypothetical protein